jgi:hypothetical protein
MEQVVAGQMQQVVTLLPQAAGTVGRCSVFKQYQGRLLPILVAVVGVHITQQIMAVLVALVLEVQDSSTVATTNTAGGNGTV